jgi:hypothetical protein
MFSEATRAAKIVANGAVKGLSSVAQGGKFEHGFFMSVGTGTLNYLYGKLVEESPELFGIGKTADLTKGESEKPTVGSLHTGIQGKDGKGWLHEGKPVPTFLGRYFPLVNAISGMHDFMQVSMTLDNDHLRTFLNIPYMVPATLITAGAYMEENQQISPSQIKRQMRKSH